MFDTLKQIRQLEVEIVNRKVSNNAMQDYVPAHSGLYSGRT